MDQLALSELHMEVHGGSTANLENTGLVKGLLPPPREVGQCRQVMEQVTRTLNSEMIARLSNMQSSLGDVRLPHGVSCHVSDQMSCVWRFVEGLDLVGLSAFRRCDEEISSILLPPSL